MNVEIQQLTIQCDACQQMYTTSLTDFELVNTDPENGGKRFRKAVDYTCGCSAPVSGRVDVKEYGGQPFDYSHQIEGGKLRALWGLKIV